MKYEKEMGKIPNCPPSNVCDVEAAEDEGEAWRVVKNCNEGAFLTSFLPEAVKEPLRKVSGGDTLLKDEYCPSWGLSLFTTKSKIQQFYDDLTARHPNISKKIGSEFATGTLVSQDGHTTKPNSRGHFTLYESASCDLPSKFSVI